MQNTSAVEKTLLYYPTIKIKDGVWLRNAILYWDKVSSIVPGVNFNANNSIEVEYLKDAGIYEPIYPLELQREEGLCEAFCRQVKKNLKLSEGYRRNGYVSRVHVEKLNMFDMLHIEKTPESILEYLLNEGIAQRDFNGTWINMNRQDADIYMATLAKYLAKAHGNTEIGTDNSFKFYYPYLPERNERVERQLYLDVALQKILPVPYMDVPILDIIDFRMRYERELKCFRRRIEAFQCELRHCRDIEDIQETTIMLQHQMDDDLQEIEELMSLKGIRRAKKTMRTLIPIGIATGVGFWAENTGMSPIGSALLGDIVGATASLFLGDDELQIEDKNAYLFYARENGFISAYRSRRI